MKYLYVLTSDVSDYYLEQTLLSITSLRMQMPGAFVSLLVDDITASNLTGRRGSVIDLVNEYKPVSIDGRFNKKARSRWLKTSIRRHVEGDFLYMDGDTIIPEDLSPLESIDINIGAVLDAHTSVSDSEKYYPERLRRQKKICEKLGLASSFDLGVYFNGGVIFCRDNKAGHDFFAEWHKLWLHCFERGSVKDQHALNQANFNMGGVVRELDGIWNCQILDDGALRYLYGAKIIHYFSSRPGEKAFLPANDNFIASIKNTGVVGKDLTELIKNPKSLFAPNVRLMPIQRASQGFYDSAFCGVSRRIFATFLGAAAEFILSGIRKNIYMPMRRKLSNRN